MKKRILTLSCLYFLAGIAAFAQTEEKALETAVHTYNNLRAFTENLKAGTLTEADIQYVDEQADAGLALLNPIVQANGQTAEVARYFRANFIYEQGYLRAMKGRLSEALEKYKTIEGDFNGYTNARFPLRYVLDEKNYIINWNNFAPTQGEFNVGMCELYSNKKDYATALPYARKAVENTYLNNWLKTIAYRLILNMKTARGENDRELLDAALHALEAYASLETEDREKGGDGLSALPTDCANTIETMLKAYPAFANGGESWARASRLLAKEKMDERALDFASRALQAGFRDRSFAEETAGKAIAANDKNTAAAAVNLLASLTAADDCAGLSNIARLYLQAGDKAKSKNYSDKADACERQKRRRERAATREGGLYIGAYVIPLFRKDWGLVGAIQTRKVLIEGSYQVGNHNRDYLLDQQVQGVDGADNEKVYWDGYYAHLAVNGIMKGGNRGARPYMGVLLGYNVREFGTLNANVTDENGVPLGSASFKPKDTRYILMYNAGFHANSRLLASDFFFSIGGSYNLFDRGNELYQEDNYTFDKILLKRKDTRFGFMLRFGFTVGLQFGPKTFR